MLQRVGQARGDGVHAAEGATSAAGGGGGGGGGVLACGVPPDHWADAPDPSTPLFDRPPAGAMPQVLRAIWERP